MSAISKTMTSSLPYLASDPKASASGAVVQSKLSAKVVHMINTMTGVKRCASAFSFTDTSDVWRSWFNSTQSAQSNNVSLTTLMIAIDKPTDMAARQIAVNRNWGSLVGKVDAFVDENDYVPRIIGDSIAAPQVTNR